MIKINQVFDWTIHDIIDQRQWEFCDYLSDVVQVQLLSILQSLKKILFDLVSQKFTNLKIASYD